MKPCQRMHRPVYFARTIASKYLHAHYSALRARGVAAGLKLLGFKPASCLQSWHRTKESKFVYPNERARAGSTVLFAALRNRMLAREVRGRTNG